MSDKNSKGLSIFDMLYQNNCFINELIENEYVNYHKKKHLFATIIKMNVSLLRTNAWQKSVK